MPRRTFLTAGLGAVLTAAAAAAEVLHASSSGARARHVVQGSPLVTTTTLPAVLASPNGPVARWVLDENTKTGTTAWNLSSIAKSGEIEGFANGVSAQRGEIVTLFVSTTAPSFHVEAYRMGWYQGTGGRIVWQSGTVPGKKQASATITPRTNMVEARWQPSLPVQITGDFLPGMYLLKLVASSGKQHWIPLVVRDDTSRAAYAVQSSVTTWQAYNSWGGYSLYGKGGTGASFSNRSRVVSFDRPYDGAGAGDFVGLELPVVMLMEQLGLDVTYTTDVDTHRHPELLLRHRAFLSLGHDEYWSKSMRDGVEAARDHGVNLAFLGANAAYRQVRFEPSAVGPDRREVCYKSATEDPGRRIDPASTTVNWRDAPVSRPESLMIGQQYECNPVRADMVVADPSAWVFAGTNVTTGQKFPTAIGTEYDRYDPHQQGPPNVQLLAHSPVTCHGKRSYSDMTYYSAPSGAGVFATGTIWWITKLTPQTFPNSPYQPTVEQIMKNVLAAFGQGPAGTTHPSTSNYDAVTHQLGRTSGPPPTGD